MRRGRNDIRLWYPENTMSHRETPRDCGRGGKCREFHTPRPQSRGVVTIFLFRSSVNLWTLFLLCMVVLLGCERSEPAQSPAPTAPSVPTPSVVAPPPPPPVAVAPPKTEQKKAAVGAGKKGRYDIVGPVVTPVASYFAIRERLAYDVQIPQAMQLFKALEGRVPNSHEEFMQKVIKDNHINLPELPEGHRYIYDPQRGELMIEQPATE